MGRYENIIVINPDCTKEEEEDLLKRITTNMEKFGANVIKVDDWAVRKLAYPIKKKDKGHYFFFLLDMAEENVTSLNKFYRNVDLILRNMFVAVTETNKGLEKPPEPVVFAELEGELA